MTDLMGRKVSWTHFSKIGLAISMSLREGTVEAIDDNMATVKLDSGKSVLVETVRLRLPGQTSQITELVQSVMESLGGDHGEVKETN